MSVLERAPILTLPLLFGLVICVFGLLTMSKANAGQIGGSIYYEDAAAVEQELEFRAYVWHVSDDYYKAVVDYRQVGAGHWEDLDQNWCWYRRCALQEMVAQSRYIARDGYIWRFQLPTPPPDRATRYRFTESCFRAGTVTCADHLPPRRKQRRTQ